jgi:S-adenosylmethionine:tRNA ribosyltransferase-isomerase
MIDLEHYQYHLPKELIRREGVEPRDSARLFVYDTTTDTITHTVFADLEQYVPRQAVMVLNNTQVVPARLFLKKETGGKIEVFVLVNEMNASDVSKLSNDETAQEIPVLVDRKCMVGWKLFFPDGSYFEVARQEENKFFVKRRSEKSLQWLLQEYGETPIPHYLEETKPKPRTGLYGTVLGNASEEHLRKRYQTIFANSGASVAAPTASLHFTERIFLNLDAIKQTEFAEVTLNVGLGTFAPLKAEHFAKKALHSEYMVIPKETAEMVNRAKEEERAVIAVGTTVLRTLESGIDATHPQRLSACAKNTQIFIFPPYHFGIANALLTNFHLPKSSLMLLVDAFLQDKRAKRGILELYTIAIEKGYSFYSFGDSMLIL